MAFSVHVNIERCTGCGNCVAACPVNALELHSADPASTASKDKIYVVQDGAAVSIDFKDELCAGCGVCVEACPMDVITLSGKGEDLNMARAATIECAETVRCYPPLSRKSRGI